MASLDRQTYKSSWNPNVAEMVLKFDDNGGGAAGTYSADVTIPAGAYILDVQCHGVVLWDAGTTASLDVGDASDANGIWTAVDLLTSGDLEVNEVLSFAHQGSSELGVLITLDDGVMTQYSASERNIKATITTAGTASTTGETRIVVMWAKPTDTVSSSVTAS